VADILVDSNILLDVLEELDAALPNEFFRREALPWEAAFLAGKCFVKYRRAGTVRGIPLLTRDARRYQTYFPKLELVAP